MSAVLSSFLLKAAPYLAVAAVIATIVVMYLRNRTKQAEDKMAADKDRELNQVSQLNAVKQVEDDMASATSSKPTTEEVSKRLTDGTF